VIGEKDQELRWIRQMEELQETRKRRKNKDIENQIDFSQKLKSELQHWHETQDLNRQR